ncbi:hypothetical protein LV84_02492 [Algoriphagus ratkowskyi]|uniref:Uncharacterized protein n=1 Tax=Algoriphagus ratkowskyi TaxID=57028 RepID=A0A2W7R4D4_9BACT|nr:hypothetical protein [Algoriphagus ratkowskyi]PZX55354.1 hypothetical protein LV84_02492 [Algoriphagus ratkowskyi]TXD79715.1 hypothetical protein ESW18_00870 [Algoriphagus ratkowskyi]
MRITHPSFKLILAPLSDAFQEGKMKQFVDFARNHDQLQTLKFNSEQMPVALRWNMHPEFGFPRQPFSVYRRVSDYSKFQIKSIISDTSAPIVFQRQFISSVDVFYLMVVSVTVTPGQSMVLTPMGKGMIEIGSKTITLNQSGTVLFKSPFMIGVKCIGHGTMTRVEGILQDDILNASDWGKIQTVGLPFRTGKIQGEGYNGDLQGFNPHVMINAKDAALFRLMIGQFFSGKPGSLTSIDSQVPDVDWQFPDPGQYLNFLSSGSGSQLDIIKSCLEKSKDQSWLSIERQPAYVYETSIDGISQVGSGNTGEDANVRIPVVAHTLLSVSTESPAALGLGFGTTDFIEPARNAQTSKDSKPLVIHSAASSQTPVTSGLMDLTCDYMIGASYTIRPSEFIELPFFNQVSKETEFCALGDEMPILVQVQDLVVLGLRQNRPERIDLSYTESLKFRWGKPNFITSSAFAKSYSPSMVELENDHYPFNDKARIGIFSPIPKDQSSDWERADHGKPLHTLPEEPVPMVGSQVNTYFMAPIDVFGRWGAWIRKRHSVSAPKPQKPGIMSVRLVLPNGEDTSGFSPSINQVECRLEIEFSWDWIDRSPRKIEFTGKFFSALLATPSGPVPTSFAKSDPSTTADKIVITFSNAGINQTPSTSIGSVSLIESSIPADDSGNPTFGSQENPAANLRKYKLIIDDMTATFTGAFPYEVAYALYARGLEKVRETADVWSAWLEIDTSIPESQRDRPAITRLPDPRPPAVTAVLADVQYTALPDNTRVARGTLNWPAASGAIFYHVWEASESAIRAVLEKELKRRFPTSPELHLLPFTSGLVARATQIKDLLDQAEYMNMCQNTFSRISKTPLTGRSFQIEIPGGSQALMLYSISSMNSANIESGKSNRAFFAVPKIVKPSAPLIQITSLPTKFSPPGTVEGVEVKVINNGRDEPEGYRLFRIRNMPINNDVGTMGLPILKEGDLTWEDATMNLPDGTILSGKKFINTSIARSWKPLVYQAVAIGQSDPANGVYGGESDASVTNIAWFTPKTAPSLLLISTSGNALGQVYILSTSITFEHIPLGKSVIQILELHEDGSRQKVFEFIASDTARGQNSLTLPLNAAEVASYPRIVRKKAVLATGITEFSIAIPLNPKPLILKVIDPQNRASEIEL